MTVSATSNPGQITVDVETIDVDTAKLYLSRNANNRPLSLVNLKRLEDALRNGEYRMNGDAVRFDVDGNLLDGQHRLTAIVNTGISMRTLVVRGLPREVFSTIDRGIIRTNVMIFGMNGVPHHRITSPAIGWLWRYTHENMNRVANHWPSSAEALQLYKENPGILDAVQRAIDGSFSRFCSVPLVAACWYECEKIDANLAQTYFSQLDTGTNLQAGEPAHTIREWMLNSKADRTHIRKTLTQFIAIAIGWNAAIEGRKLVQVKVRPWLEGKTPRFASRSGQGILTNMGD